MAISTLAPCCWHVHQWPAIDQRLWSQGCALGDGFDDSGAGADLRPASIEKVRKGYGRWLDFLAGQGWLDPATQPLERLSNRRLEAYFWHLQGRGNADFTIIGRFEELALAMRILAPGQKTAWITRHSGVSVYDRLPKRRRALMVPSAEVMLAWGYGMMDAEASNISDIHQLCAFRDGLLITLFATCARRLRSVSLMRFGHELIKIGHGYRIEFTPDQIKIKAKGCDCFDLPERLTPFIDRYIHTVRPRLLAGAHREQLWINKFGKACTPKSIQSRVLALSLKRFGTAFGPHRFRYSIATSAPHLAPANPAIGAEVIGISQAVLQDHYNRAEQARAANAYEACLERRIAIAEARLVGPARDRALSGRT